MILTGTVSVVSDTVIENLRTCNTCTTYNMIQSITENNNREKQPNFMTEMRFQRE